MVASLLIGMLDLDLLGVLLSLNFDRPNSKVVACSLASPSLSPSLILPGFRTYILKKKMTQT